MKTFILQLRWQFILLQKNKIISISLGVTVLYGLILYFLRDVGKLDTVMVSLVLNDPSVIGFFFVALAIYTEIRHKILSAISVSPVNIHQLLIAKTLSISLVGVFCSIALAISVKGFQFGILNYAIGSFGICFLSSLLGIIVLSFASEFLKFVMLSIPLFLFFINIPLLQYLGAIDMGVFRFIFPIQGSVELIDNAISDVPVNLWYSGISIVMFTLLFYMLAYRQFSNRIIYK